MRLLVKMTNEEQVLKPLQGLNREMNQVVNSALRRSGQAMRASLGKGIRKESFLKSASIRGDIKKPVMGEGEITVTVAGRKHGADSFKLIPSRITVKKGMRSKDWPSTAFQVGPNVSVWRPSKAFVLLTKEGNKRMFQRKGRGLQRVMGVSAQYFSVFDQVAEQTLERGRETFEKRLMHEVGRKLGAI